MWTGLWWDLAVFFFCVGGVWQESGFSGIEAVSHLIYIIKTRYKFVAFGATDKDNVAMNCATVQHRKVTFP